ncbi:hypothetical protein Tco_1515696 [Tanacetum coccineum]
MTANRISPDPVSCQNLGGWITSIYETCGLWAYHASAGLSVLVTRLRESDSKRIIVIPDKDMSHHIIGYRIDKYKIDIMKQRDRFIKEITGGGVVDLTGDEDPTDEDGDIGVSVSLGDEIFLEGKKSQESNIGDSDNTGDGGKIAGRAIITWGGGIASLISESEGTIVE